MLATFFAGVFAGYIYLMWALPIMNLRDKKGSPFNNVTILIVAFVILITIILAIGANTVDD